MNERLKLYGGALSPYVARVRLVAGFKGIDLDHVPPPGGMMSEPYKNITPIGRIPSLELPGGFVLPESETICEYLDETFPEPCLLPGSPEARARIRLLSRIADSYLMKGLGPFFALVRNIELDQMRAARWRDQICEALSFLDRYFLPGRYAAGDQPTLADCTLIPMLFYTETFLVKLGWPNPIDDFPNVEAYWTGVQSDGVVERFLSELRSAVEIAMSGRPN